MHTLLCLSFRIVISQLSSSQRAISYRSNRYLSRLKNCIMSQVPPRLGRPGFCASEPRSRMIESRVILFLMLSLMGMTTIVSSLYAQTNVATSGGGAFRTIPHFTSNADIENSLITQASGSVYVDGPLTTSGQINTGGEVISFSGFRSLASFITDDWLY
jgi:hypothetical protein